MEYRKYIHMGKSMNLLDFRLDKGTVYFGEKIERLLEKQPLLKKILIPVEEIETFENNEKLINEISNRIIEGGNE